MRLRIVGCGDAFGSGGRANTCFWLECGATTLALDFGATSLVELKRAGLDHERLDFIVLSHLHGDHFGGLPFLLLDAQFGRQRERPLTIVGPVGTRERVAAATEIFFPGCSRLPWRFPLTIVDLPCGTRKTLGSVTVSTMEVVHPSGAPSTGVRLRAGGRLLAFSGDTEWTDALPSLAKGADLLLIDCYAPNGPAFFHGVLDTIAARRAELKAGRIMLTHLGDAMLGRIDEAVAQGFLVAHDGLVLDV